MNEELLLTSLRATLGISSQIFNNELLVRIRAAQSRIRREGITLEDNTDDRDLVVMYAAYLWRSRSTGEEMPRMLRYALNNRLFAGKASGEG